MADIIQGQFGKPAGPAKPDVTMARCSQTTVGGQAIVGAAPKIGDLVRLPNTAPYAAVQRMARVLQIDDKTDPRMILVRVKVTPGGKLKPWEGWVKWADVLLEAKFPTTTPARGRR